MNALGGFKLRAQEPCIGAMESGPSADGAADVVRYTNCLKNRRMIPFMHRNRPPCTRRPATLWSGGDC